MNRGRPRHNDILTPREWQVLDLLKQGLTNEQIGERLGIAHNTVKFHVSEILGKLGLESRRQVARWEGKRKVAFSLAPLGVLMGKLKTASPTKLLAASVIGVAAAALIALVIGVLMMTQGHTVPSEAAITVPIQWIEEELPPPVSWEADRPFADVVGTENDTWRAYVIEDGKSPELILETDRYLGYGAAWYGDQIILPFMSRKEWSDGTLGQPIHGLLAVEPGNSDPLWERVTDDAVASVSPDGSGMLLMTGRETLWLQGIGASAQRVEGIRANLSIAGWSPDGERVVVMGWEDDPNPNDLRAFTYVLTPGEDEALKLDTSNGEPMSWYNPRWSPDGSRLAYPEGGDIVVVDVESATSRRIKISDSPFPRTLLSWSEDSRYVLYADGVVDAVTGRLNRQPHSDALGTVILSPDSRYLVVSGDSSDPSAFGKPACPEIQTGFYSNRTMIYDLVEGDEAEVLSCLDLPFSPRVWLDDERVLMYGYNCGTCDGSAKYAIVNVHDGSVEILTERLPNLALEFAPDGRFLVTGNTLAVYAPDGALLSEYSSPGDTPIRDATFSPMARASSLSRARRSTLRNCAATHPSQSAPPCRIVPSLRDSPVPAH